MLAGDDARAARRTRHQESMRQDRLQRLAKQYWKPTVVVLGIGLFITAVAVTQISGVGQKDCPGHWHATFQVYVDETPVMMAPTSADNAPAPGFHMHANDNILHTHPAAPRCVELRDALSSLNIDVAEDALDIAPLSGADRSTVQGIHRADGQRELAIYHQPFEGEWRKASLSLLREQIGNGDKVLITIGTLDEVTIQAQQESVPDLPPQYQPA